MFQLPSFWAGDDQSLDLLASAMESVYAMTEARAGKSSSPFELPPLVNVQDGVGVVSLKGSLVAGSAGLMRLFGITGYTDFQEALLEAATDKSVKSIMLDVASGGGDVNGVDETSDILKQIAALKPVMTYASGLMNSAAYWLGSAGTRRLASQTSQVGSIGVIAVHMERTKQMEKDGVTPTVVRSGKWKALGGPYEKLSALAEAEITKQVMAISGIFENRVASNLGTTQAKVHDRMGQGRVFLGAEAVDVGLIHGIATHQQAFLAAKAMARS
jgi:signal peptide peptidase SppA